MTTALEGGEGSASRPGRSLAPGKTRYPLYRRVGEPQGRSRQVAKISPPRGFDPRTVRPVARRYTDYATRPNCYSMCQQLKSSAFCPSCTFVDFVLFGIKGNSSPTQHYNFDVCVGDTMCFLRCKKSDGYSKFFHPYCYKDSLLQWCDTVQLCEYSSTFRRLLLSTTRQEMLVPAHIRGQTP